jgi:hypothetical protein
VSDRAGSICDLFLGFTIKTAGYCQFSWSIALAGCGIKGGSVSGKTNAEGTAVTDRQVHSGHLFHTYLQALGFSSKKNFYIEQRPIPIADPKATPLTEVLA